MLSAPRACAGSDDGDAVATVSVTLGKRGANGAAPEAAADAGLHASIRKLERSGDCYVAVPPEGDTAPRNLRCGLLPAMRLCTQPLRTMTGLHSPYGPQPLGAATQPPRFLRRATLLLDLPVWGDLLVTRVRLAGTSRSIQHHGPRNPTGRPVVVRPLIETTWLPATWTTVLGSAVSLWATNHKSALSLVHPYATPLPPAHNL